MLVCLVYYASLPSYEWLGAALRAFIDDAEELTSDLSMSNRERVAAALQVRLKMLEDDQKLNNEDKAVRLALSSFLLGLVTLIVFATRNLPFDDVAGAAPAF